MSINEIWIQPTFCTLQSLDPFTTWLDRELPLNIAAASGESEVVEMPVRHGSFIHVRDSSLLTAMEAAEDCGNVACVNLIRDHIAATEPHLKNSIRQRTTLQKLLSRFTGKV